MNQNKHEKLLANPHISVRLDPISKDVIIAICDKFNCNHSQAIRIALKEYYDRNNIKLDQSTNT